MSRGAALLKSEGQAALNVLYTRVKKNSKQRGIDFNLSFLKHSNLIIKNCFYCGAKPVPYNPYLKQKQSKSAIDRAWIVANGIDRLNSDLGYHIDNCVPCCSQCNYSKLDYTVQEYIKHCIQVAQFQKEAA